MVCKNRLFLIFIYKTIVMAKKEFTKKQLKEQLTLLTEGGAANKKNLSKAYHALQKLKAMKGSKIGDKIIDSAALNKIKAAWRLIEDLFDKTTDEDITKQEDEKEKEESKKVTEKNEQSEGHGKMYNALQGVREGKVVKVNEGTLKRIVERVIKEQKNVSFDDMLSNLSTAVTRIKKVSTTAWKKSEPALTDKELADGKKKAVTELKSILDSYTK